jgi:hypothetical protein
LQKSNIWKRTHIMISTLMNPVTRSQHDNNSILWPIGMRIQDG